MAVTTVTGIVTIGTTAAAAAGVDIAADRTNRQLSLLDPFPGKLMKKSFKMSHPKIKTPRLVEAIKHEVKKYLQRERRKPLPPDIDYWDFDCRFGVDEAQCEPIHVADINKAISQAEEQQLDSFYLEILAKPGRRGHKP